MKILLIGNRGFIGSHCQDYLSKTHSVIGCDVLPVKTSTDFCVKDAVEISELIRNNKFNLIINASGSPGVGFSLEYTEKDKKLNYSNVVEWINAIYKHSPATRFLNFSSAAVYGNPNLLPINEDTELKPMSPYGEHKKLTEEFLQDSYSKLGIQSIGLRIFSAYGPRLHKQLFYDIYKKSQISSQIELSGTGEESRDFIFISDIVSAIEIIINAEKFIGQSINLASGVETTIGEAAQLFLDSIGKNHHLTFNGLQKTGDPKNWRADISVLKKLGFKPDFTIQEGIKKTADYYIENLKT